MSLTQTVADMVSERGAATVDDLLPELAEEGYTREQVIKALQNAKHRGLLENRRGKGLGPGSMPSTYTPKRTPKQRAAAPSIGRVASVWELGALNA